MADRDEVFDIPDPPDGGFINDCEYRVLLRPDTPAMSGAICKLISLQANIRTGVTGFDCAKCKLSGQIDDMLIRSKVTALLKNQFSMFNLGFYADLPVEKTKELFRRAYKHFITPSDRQFLMHQFTAAVATKRICPKWGEEFLRTEMPDLLSPIQPQDVAEVLPLSVTPAKQENRAMDVNFGCCGGRDIFRLLRREVVTLTGPTGEPVKVQIANIASLRPVPNSNVQGAKTVIRYHDESLLLVKEDESEFATALKDLANASSLEDPTDESFTAKMLNAGKSLVDVIKALYGTPVSDEEYASRKKQCEACTAVDNKGEKLFRPGKKGGWFSCGAPFLQKPFRDKAKDGCGCWLQIKWGGKDQHCPLKPPRW